MRVPVRLAFAAALAVVGAVAVSAAVPRVAVAEEEKAAPKTAVTFEEGLATFDALLAKAKTEAKPAFLDFYSPT